MNTSLLRHLVGRPRILAVTATSAVVACAGAAISWAAVAHESTQPTAHAAVLATTVRTPTATPVITPAPTPSPTTPTPVPTAVPTPVPTATPRAIVTRKPKPTATPVTSGTADHPTWGIEFQFTTGSVAFVTGGTPVQVFTAQFPVLDADPELQNNGELQDGAGTPVQGRLWSWSGALNDTLGPEGSSAYYAIDVYDPNMRAYDAIQYALIGTYHQITFAGFPAWQVDSASGVSVPTAAARELYVQDGPYVLHITGQGSAATVATFFDSIHLSTLS